VERWTSWIDSSAAREFGAIPARFEPRALEPITRRRDGTSGAAGDEIDAENGHTLFPSDENHPLEERLPKGACSLAPPDRNHAAKGDDDG
jgi:hypothetical protein